METSHTAIGEPRALASGRSLSTARFLPKAAALAALALLAACTSAQSQIETGGQMLPRPEVVIVESFAVSPDEVQLGEGLSTEIVDAVKAEEGTSRSDQERQTGRQVADAIADELVVELQDMGLTAQQGGDVPAGTEHAVLIKGQLVSIDEGNRTLRVVVGLGAGRSDVQTHVQVYQMMSAGPELIDTIEVDAKSGLTPGMAETMGVGALTGHLLVSAAVSGGAHVVSESLGANVVADADRAAKGIAKQLAVLFAQQGWITR
jgi:Domain of unknown function (DUF4410)